MNAITKMAALQGAEMIEIGGQQLFVLKAQPTQGDVHVNGVLTNVAIAYAQKAENFIADKVFPKIGVSKQSDLYRIYDRSWFNRSEMAVRAPGTRAKVIEYTMSTTSYYCPVFGIAHSIDDQVRSNADADINLERNATRLLAQQALLKREIAFVENVFKTGVWGFERAGVASGEVAGTSVRHWNDANSDPIGDIKLAKRTMAEATGYEPNKLTLGWKVWDDLTEHPDIIARISGGAGVSAASPVKVTRQTIAALFEVDDIYVMKAIRNTAKEGQTEANSFIGGRHAMLTHTPNAASTDVPSAGYTFGWTGYLGADDSGTRVRRFREEPIHSDTIELEMAFTQKVTATDLGWFFNNIVAA